MRNKFICFNENELKLVIKISQNYLKQRMYKDVCCSSLMSRYHAPVAIVVEHKRDSRVRLDSSHDHNNPYIHIYVHTYFVHHT